MYKIKVLVALETDTPAEQHAPLVTSLAVYESCETEELNNVLHLAMAVDKFLNRRITCSNCGEQLNVVQCMSVRNVYGDPSLKGSKGSKK